MSSHTAEENEKTFLPPPPYDLWNGQSLNLHEVVGGDGSADSPPPPALPEPKPLGRLLDLPIPVCMEIEKKNKKKKRERRIRKHKSLYPRDKPLIFKDKCYYILSKQEERQEEGGGEADHLSDDSFYVISNRWFTCCSMKANGSSSYFSFFLQVPYEDRCTPYQPFYYMVRTRVSIPMDLLHAHLHADPSVPLLPFHWEHRTRAGTIVCISFKLDRERKEEEQVKKKLPVSEEDIISAEYRAPPNLLCSQFYFELLQETYVVDA